MSQVPAFLPGSTIGVMGGGQLGRMFAIAARRMGYRVHSFSPDEDTPAGQLCDLEYAARYDDRVAVEAFAEGIDVLTFEFENVPWQTIEWCRPKCVVRPSGEILRICQHRRREKEFLAGAGIPLPRFAAVDSASELAAAVAEIGLPAVLKTASFGYDGRGQQKLEPGADLEAIWRSFGGEPAVLEAWVPYEKEVSICVARGVDGEIATYPVCENLHRHHILDVTKVPAEIAPETAAAAERIAREIASRFDLVGLLAVEMFVLPGGEILVNQLAPRPHNSGHFSFDAAVTSQFEQQLRAVCGLPLGSTAFRPCAMANLLGDLWQTGEPDWEAVAGMRDVKLHLYGKHRARPGRKMGHLVAFGESSALAAERVLEARAKLRRE